MGRNAGALDAYAQLAPLRNVAIEGVPAELIALNARCGLLEALGRRAELNREAVRMNAGLRSCRWALTGAAWEFHRQQARRWADTAALTDAERRALAVSRAAEWLYQPWPRPLEPKGRRILNTEQAPVLVSWSIDSAGIAAVLASPDRVATIWKNAQANPGARTALVDPDGNVVMGSAAPSGLKAVRHPRIAGGTSADPRRSGTGLRE